MSSVPGLQGSQNFELNLYDPRNRSTTRDIKQCNAILEKIFSYVDSPKALFRSCSVSKAWNRAANKIIASTIANPRGRQLPILSHEEALQKIKRQIDQLQSNQLLRVKLHPFGKIEAGHLEQEEKKEESIEEEEALLEMNFAFNHGHEGRSRTEVQLVVNLDQISPFTYQSVSSDTDGSIGDFSSSEGKKQRPAKFEDELADKIRQNWQTKVKSELQRVRPSPELSNIRQQCLLRAVASVALICMLIYSLTAINFQEREL